MSFKPIVAAISFSLALFLLLFMVWPEYQELQDINQQISRAETKLEKGKEYVSQLETLSEQLKKHEEAVKKVESSLPSKPKVPTLLNFLRGASKDHGLLLKEVGSISSKSHRANIKRMSVNLSLVGSYSSFKSFVEAVEKSSRVIDVEQVSFRAPEEEGPSRFNLRVSTYYYAPQ